MIKPAVTVFLACAIAGSQAYAFGNSFLSGSGDGATNQFQTSQQKLGYSLGVEMGNSFRKLHIDLDPYSYMLGMKDAMNAGRIQMPDDEMRSTLISFKREMMAQTPGYEALKERNQKEGEQFLAENKTRSGVVTLPDGLQYKVIVPGTGDHPTDKDIVAVNYVGKLVNGRVFDSAFSSGPPMVFQADSMIPGWTEALRQMPVGSTWDVFIPASLAYNELGSQPSIGPEQTLIYRIKLVSIVRKADEAKPAGDKQNIKRTG